ncbi:MAG: hypothetical protein K0B06_02770 [Brevefilum sp.]|nr:hypothetical protein [Brevefilum sp.]
MSLYDLIWGGVGLLLTVMVLSYLIGDNLLFRLAAYLFVGVTAGFLSVLIINQILWPFLLQPLINGLWIEKIWVLIPLTLAVLLVISQFQRFKGLGRVPLAFLAGLTAAVTVGGAVFGTLIPQLRAVVNAFDPLDWYQSPGMPWLRITEAVVMLVGVLGTLSYFHFGRRRRDQNDPSEVRPGFFEGLAKVGGVFLGMALGTVFAGIFSTALVAMIDRLLVISEFVMRLMGGS